MIFPLVEIAASIVRREDGRVLMAERRHDQIASGYWELPGGKIERGEDAASAAARELFEETGVRAGQVRRGPVHEHTFPTRRVRVHWFHADDFSGDAIGRENQNVAWVDPANPIGPILPSNERIFSALALPPIYAVVRAGRGTNPRSLIDASNAAFADGVRLLQLRASVFSPDQRVALGRRVGDCAARYGADVMLAGTAIEARRSGVKGIHSAASSLRQTYQRPQVGLWGVSCHGQDDVAAAVELDADFAVLSPVLPSARHPDVPPLGWETFRQIAIEAPIPVYAQGGLAPRHVAEARAAGAVGVALSLDTVPGGGDER